MAARRPEITLGSHAADQRLPDHARQFAHLVEQAEARLDPHGVGQVRPPASADEVGDRLFRSMTYSRATPRSLPPGVVEAWTAEQ
jgi:hypothetical protein